MKNKICSSEMGMGFEALHIFHGTNLVVLVGVVPGESAKWLRT